MKEHVLIQHREVQKCCFTSENSLTAVKVIYFARNEEKHRQQPDKTERMDTD